MNNHISISGAGKLTSTFRNGSILILPTRSHPERSCFSGGAKDLAWVAPDAPGQIPRPAGENAGQSG